MSLRSAIPGDEIDTTYDKERPPEVVFVYWAHEEHESYEYYNNYWLVEFADGRFASVSSLSSGTCSYCGSSSDDVAFARTLREAVQFGMGEAERQKMGISL